MLLLFNSHRVYFCITLFIENVSGSRILLKNTSQHSDDVSIYISCLLSFYFVNKARENVPSCRKKEVNRGIPNREKKAELGRLLGIPRKTINKIILKIEVHGSVANRHQSGRKPKFTVRDEVQLSRVMKNNRRGTLND